MPREKTEAAHYERVTLRLPPDDLRALREQALDIGRPLNTHILRILHSAVEKQKRSKKNLRIEALAFS